MRSLWELFRYEMKKLLRRKVIWITLVSCLMLLAVVVLSALMGNYHGGGETLWECRRIFLEEWKGREALSGRKVDQAMLSEMWAAYKKIPDAMLSEENYTLTKGYMTYARPYSEIFKLVRAWTGWNVRSAVYKMPDEENLYKSRKQMLEAYWEFLGLSDVQREFWREKEAEIVQPISYYRHDGYYIIIVVLPMTALCMMLAVSVSMSGVFAEERARRTDQVVYACPKGRGTLYWAKILAGICTAVLHSLLMTVTVVGSAFCVFGAEGFQTPVQFFMPRYSYPLTMGQACLILYGIFILTSVFISIFVMVMSEVTGSSMAALAVSAGMLTIGFAVTMLYERIQHMPQIWSFLSTTFLWHQTLLDARPVTLFGKCFVSWQVVPAVHLLYGAAAAAVGRIAYGCHQVRER